MNNAESQPSLLALTPAEVVQSLAAWGEPQYRADQIFQWIYQRGVLDFDGMSNLPAILRAKLSEAFSLGLPRVVRTLGSSDSTQKFLIALADGQLVETVLIPASPALYGEPSDRRTLCVSSQVGCAYGCRFCASGLDGWKRNLTPDEIVGQVLAVQQASGHRANNLVFMGMGEPLANYENLIQAIRVLNDAKGPGIGARRITVSTSGLTEGIRALAEEPLQIRLAISLHAPTDEVRDKIMPVNRRHNLAELLAACRYHQSRKKQLITFEYILIKDLNDAPTQAESLARLLTPLRAKVNLIPYNCVEGLDWERPSEPVLNGFLEKLKVRGLPATLRLEKGHDIAAACGQLRLQTAEDYALRPQISSVTSAG